MTVITQREHKKQMRKDRNPAIKECTNCGLEIHEQTWHSDEEGLKFCDKDCAKFHREEVVGQ